MPSLARTLAAFALAACSHPHTGLDGFEGTISVHMTETGSKDTDFTVTAKGGKLRIDLPPPSVQPATPEVTLGHVVYEHSTNGARLFFDSTKEYREMDLAKHIAGADAGDATGTLDRLGTEKVIAGTPCTDWSLKTETGRTDVCLARGLAYLEIFRVKYGPHGAESPLAKEYREHSTFPLELVERDRDGKEHARMEVTKIVRASVDDDVFSLRSDYAKVDPHFGSGHPPAR